MERAVQDRFIYEIQARAQLFTWQRAGWWHRRMGGRHSGHNRHFPGKEGAGERELTGWLQEAAS